MPLYSLGLPILEAPLTASMLGFFAYQIEVLHNIRLNILSKNKQITQQEWSTHLSDNCTSPLHCCEETRIYYGEHNVLHGIAREPFKYQFIKVFQKKNLPVFPFGATKCIMLLHLKLINRLKQILKIFQVPLNDDIDESMVWSSSNRQNDNMVNTDTFSCSSLH